MAPYTEKNFQEHIISELQNKHNYIVREAKDNYSIANNLDEELLFKFLYATQSDILTKYTSKYKDKLNEKLLSEMQTSIADIGLFSTLKKGFTVDGDPLKLFYPRPETKLNKGANENYTNNIFSVMKEVPTEDKDRIDLVLFLNGIPIVAIELKYSENQTYEDAIHQFRYERDPNQKLLNPKTGALVYFAMDDNEAYMTTSLDKVDTYFLPFNQGKGIGKDMGAGNPDAHLLGINDFNTYYMWYYIFKPDTLLDIISHFMFYDKGRLIFPRYHQLTLLAGIINHALEYRTSQNYLAQDTQGSGKSYAIAWAAHRLSTLHDEQDKLIYDKVVVMTDTVTIDRQLQKIIEELSPTKNYVRAMDDSCTSKDLKEALEDNTKVVVTTIQKFNHIVDAIRGLHNSKFAVIIDEAHSSTSGKEMDNVNKSLNSPDVLTTSINYDDEEKTTPEQVEEIIKENISRYGKQENIAIYAFTGTARPITLLLFGKEDSPNHFLPHHIYSMKQAIEEGFILNPLSNYTTYNTYYNISKIVQNNIKCKAGIKKLIHKYVHNNALSRKAKIEIMVSHFIDNVQRQLGGRGKAMLLCDSKLSAVEYYHDLIKYLKNNKITTIKPAIAFSGKVTYNGKEVTEKGINGVSEAKLPDEIDADKYNLLIVANKYQKGYDQPTLCAMYVDKPLEGVNAAQTLTRIDRIFPGYDKITYVLDFKNDYDDISKAFDPYFTVTDLKNEATPDKLEEVKKIIDDYAIVTEQNITDYAETYCSFSSDAGVDNSTYAARERQIVKECSDRVEAQSSEEKQKIILYLQKFCKAYNFLKVTVKYEDIEMEKASLLYNALKKKLTNTTGGGNRVTSTAVDAKHFNVNATVKINNYRLEEDNEENDSTLTGGVSLESKITTNIVVIPERITTLDDIIKELNLKSGKKYKAGLLDAPVQQIVDKLAVAKDIKLIFKNNEPSNCKQILKKKITQKMTKEITDTTDIYNKILNDDAILAKIVDIVQDKIIKILKEEGNS